MTRLPEIWKLLRNHMPRDKWIHITKIYNIVETYAKLDQEDFDPQSPKSSIPKWKRNTRNVLQYRKIKGDVRWKQETEEYFLPMLH